MKEILDCIGSTVARNVGVNAVLMVVIRTRGITWYVDFVTKAR